MRHEFGQQLPQRTVAQCHKRTHAPQQTEYLFDHFVGPDQQRTGKLNAERLGVFQVDDEIEFEVPTIMPEVLQEYILNHTPLVQPQPRFLITPKK